MTLGQFLRQLRAAKDVPIRVVAAAAEMDQAHLSKVELGQRLPTEAHVIALARYFGIDAADLEARRIAEKFRQQFADNPAAERAVMLLNESAIPYRTKK